MGRRALFVLPGKPRSRYPRERLTLRTLAMVADARVQHKRLVVTRRDFVSVHLSRLQVASTFYLQFGARVKVPAPYANENRYFQSAIIIASVRDKSATNETNIHRFSPEWRYASPRSPD